jgi:hypothetical protein
MHKRGDEGGIHYSLDLLLCASSDVGDGPARLLLDALLVVLCEHLQEAAQGSTLDDHLGLHVVARDDVAHRAQCRHQYTR